MSELYAVKYGLELQKSDPEVADEYRAGKTLPMLVNRFRVVARFSLNSNQVHSAISIPYFALAGNHYDTLGETYDGLLSAEEAREIGAKHRLDAQIASGLNLQENGLGIFGLSSERRTAISSKTGKAMKKERKGIFSLTSEQRIAMGQVAATDSGYVIYPDEEVILAYLLLEMPQLRHPNGRKKLSEMKDLVNLAFYDGKPARTENSLRSLWRRKKGFMESVAEEEIERVRETLDALLNS